MERDIAFLTSLLADHLLATEMPIPKAILKPRQSLEGQNPHNIGKCRNLTMMMCAGATELLIGMRSLQNDS